MSNRIKFILSKKILPNISQLPLNIARSINVESKTDSFCLDLNESIYLYCGNEMKEFKKRLFSSDSHFFKLIESENTNIRLQCERNFFIKNILEEIVKPTTIIENIKKKIAIDFSSPNIAKPFHMGHLRSTIIGNFIGNINSHFNNEVIKINYLGDWGTQFGLLKIGLREQNIDVNKLKNDPIKLLHSCYVEGNKLASANESVLDEARKHFSQVEQGLEDLGEWKLIRSLTVDELTTTYDRLGVKFDIYNWESDYNANCINNVIQLLSDKNILKTDELGRKVATAQNRNVVVMKSDRSTLYLSRDLAALLDRYTKYNFDKMLYVVDNSQTDHFSALFEIATKLHDTLSYKCEHIKFGRVKGMSSRKGTVVFLKDILDEAQEKMRQKQLQSPNTRSSTMNDKTCDILGVTAVIINDLKQRRQRDYSFDWDRALQTEGDSGIKLQYLHCRLLSIEEKCGFTIPPECNPELLQEPVVSELVAELGRFDDVLYKSYIEMEACYLVSYMFKLARRVNKAVKNLRVMNEKEDIARQRLLLFHASRLVIKRGLEILGVKPLNQM